MQKAKTESTASLWRLVLWPVIRCDLGKGASPRILSADKTLPISCVLHSMEESLNTVPWFPHSAWTKGNRLCLTNTNVYFSSVILGWKDLEGLIRRVPNLCCWYLTHSLPTLGLLWTSLPSTGKDRYHIQVDATLILESFESITIRAPLAKSHLNKYGVSEELGPVALQELMFLDSELCCLGLAARTETRVGL